MNDWISVQDRLPESEYVYLVYREPKDEYWSPEPVAIRRWNGHVWATQQTVTHWMPLPKAPKKEEK